MDLIHVNKRSETKSMQQQDLYDIQTISSCKKILKLFRAKFVLPHFKRELGYFGSKIEGKGVALVKGGPLSKGGLKK